MCPLDAVRDPFSPGAGRPPAALVGRERQRVAWRVALDRTERGRTALPAEVPIPASWSAQEDGTGLAILIDEAQDLSPEELTAVCATAHVAGQRGLPLLFALAGLPNLPRVLAEAKSYAERLFAFERIEHLPDDLAHRAGIEPGVAQGVA